jgi:hypothetical protein
MNVSVTEFVWHVNKCKCVLFSKWGCLRLAIFTKYFILFLCGAPKCVLLIFTIMMVFFFRKFPWKVETLQLKYQLPLTGHLGRTKQKFEFFRHWVFEPVVIYCQQKSREIFASTSSCTKHLDHLFESKIML